MKIRFPFSIFPFTAFLFFYSFSFAQEIHFNLVTRPNDDIGSIITGMTQDTQGFLWLSTQNGLYKYDGYQYSSYHNEPFNQNSPAADNIQFVAADKAGYIWLGTSQSGLDRLDPSTGIFTHFRHNDSDSGSLSNDNVLTILQDHEGTLWIGTLGGLDRFDSKSNKFMHYRNIANDPSSISCNIIMEIYEDKQGTIWVGTGTAFQGYDSCGGLNKLNKTTGKFIRYMHNDKDPHSLIDNRVGAIFEDNRGNLWVGTAGDGLHTMDRTKGTFERHLYDPFHPDKLSRPPIKNGISYAVDHITFITEDNKSRIWIGTFEGGINVYNPSTQKVSYYGTDKNSKEKIADNRYWTAYKTMDNVIWISTFGSNLYKIVPYQNILPYTRIGKEVHSFAEDDAHTLWIGTVNGLIHKSITGKEEQFLIDKDSSSLSNGINQIEKDNSKFWLTTPFGLYLFDPVAKAFLGYHHHDGNVNSLLSDDVYIVKKAADNKLWIGGSNGLDLMDTKSGTFTHFQNSLKDTGSISDNVVIAVNIDKKHNVWVGTSKGLNRLNTQTGRFKRYLNQLTVIRIIEDSGGDLWCSSPTGGLFKYDKESDNFLSFTDESGIITTSLPVYGITEDHERNLWLTTPKGIIGLNKERNSAVLYGKNQGVNSLALRTFSYTLQNGDIICGDTSGYYQFKPALLQQNGSPPFVTVSNFLLNNIPVQPSAQEILSVPLMQTKEIRLQHNQNTFSFQFSNIDFVSPHEDTRLLYMLQNYDNAWRKAGDERTAYYFNLPSGNYVFKVKAINAAGVAAEKDIAVVISPPWWETWWFRSFSVMAMIVVVYSIVQERSRNLKKQNIMLEEKVMQRTKELNHSLEELRQTQAHLIQSEKMASLGELTAGIAHEIQNPLNFVNNFSEVNKELIQELREEKNKGNGKIEDEILNDIEQNLEKVIHHGKRADSIVKGMLQHSRISTGTKEPTDINALADEYLRLSYHGMRAKDKTFNVMLKTYFDATLGKINIVPQDIGRVLLNLFNNAFYAVMQKKNEAGDSYEPVVCVTTKNVDGKVEIHVKDNGTGIPQKVVDKIFQPFFTTKPTGQGTGLGLSLSYDIIKAHGGEIKVETREGEGAEFVVQLSLKENS
jgi:signal transduction histidine kinase/ligand-binding sensor domain-containing protein